jgi:hypothetical protein
MYLQTIGAYTFGCQGGFPEEKKNTNNGFAE